MERLGIPQGKVANLVKVLEEKTLPLQLRAYFVDENGERISNEVKMIADSRSNEAVGCVFKEKFIFRAKTYDKRKMYELILENDLKESIYERYSFTVDMCFYGSIRIEDRH